MTNVEAIATLTRRIRGAMSGENAPLFGTPERDELQRAVAIVVRSGTYDLQALGMSALQVLVESMQAELIGQRAAVVAQIAAVRGEGPAA